MIIGIRLSGQEIVLISKMMYTDIGCDETVHVVCPCELKTDKKYKEKKLKEIVAAICAMLNSNGGKVVLYDTKRDPPCSLLPMVGRMLEQFMISIMGPHLTISKICIEGNEESVTILVRKADSLITTNYNIFLPSETQVVQLDPRVPLKNVRDIMSRKAIWEPVILGSHQKTFYIGQKCGLRESKTCNFKQLKADQSKRTTLADRMTGKSNKFTCYVSAFANYRGGHIYYGIVDGVVEGEVVCNEEDKRDISIKVAKVINKMIWPEKIGQPKRGGQWDVFFEPVVTEKSMIISSTFVIVIYIAPCPGGVFKEEPECYEMVERKVHKMTFITWKRKIQYLDVFLSHKPTFHINRITWSSNHTRNICTFVEQFLSQSLNSGRSIKAISDVIESQYQEMDEIKLLLLSKKVMVSYRSNCFRTAEKSLREYEVCLPKAKEFGIFNAILAYLNVALCRARGRNELSLIFHALHLAEITEPGLITASIYILVANVLCPGDNETRVEASALLHRALEHLRSVHDSPTVRADMEQKAHITLALDHLGYNAYGSQTKKTINTKDLDAAKSSLAEVDKLIGEGNPINNYRNVQLHLAKAYILCRQSEIHPDKSLSQEAFQLSKQAVTLATDSNFQEMLQYARVCLASCIENLIRTHFAIKRTAT